MLPHRMIALYAAPCAVLLLACGVAGASIPATGECASLRAAIEDLAVSFPDDYPRGQEFLTVLSAFEARRAKIETMYASGKPPQRKKAEEEIAAFRRLQREALVANPLISAPPILYVARRQYKPDHHNTATMFQTGEINTGSFEGGSALRVIHFGQGGAVRTLLELPDGIVRDPEVHFDGKKIVFSMRKDIEDDYHIYEVNTDGSGLRQLTFARGVSDIDPLYLPDDSIVFSSTREPKYCMCNRHIMCNLFRMDADGANIHQIGKSTLFEGHGALMPDGRILYYRWEYVDRNFGDAQGLWTVFPDGTNHAVYWGNNTQSPGAVFNARAIPGTQQVLCIFGSCHDRPWGALAILDRRLGLDGATECVRSDSVIRTWPEDAIHKVGEGAWDSFNFDTFIGVAPKYEDPFPLNEKYFLCSRATGKGERMGIYLVDVFGNELLLHAEENPAPTWGCYDPMPIAPSPRPPAIAPRRDFENEDGYFYVADVYEGTHMQGVRRGAVKYLRVVASPEKRFWTHPPWDGQGQEAPAMAWHDFNNKTILGTVPVEEDGSAYFAAPPDTFMYFQLLDEKGMMIQSMRSGTMVQSGERQGCVGCHEDRRRAAPLPTGGMPAALRRLPSRLDGWYGPPRTFSYLREVQPVLDQHCVRCHDYGEEAGKKLNLAGDLDLVFNTSYNELWRKKIINAIGAGPAQIQQAYSWGGHASKLIEVIDRPHHDLALSAEGFDRIVTWIDINAPYYPEYASAYPEHLAGRSPLDNAQIERLTALTGVPFAKLMAFHSNTGPQITFNRPENSPCLTTLRSDNPQGYAEALVIIDAGWKMLERRPPAGMDGFEACTVDQERQAKYLHRLEQERSNRNAIRTGIKVYDSP